MNETHPLTAATYIPGPESFGPGVGIPPLETPSRPAFDNANQSYEHTSANGSPYRKDGSIPPTPVRYVPAPLLLHDNVHELISPGMPTATPQNPRPQSAGRGADMLEALSHPHNISQSTMSPSEAAAIWPLDRVLLWLAQNGFSSDWQETFKTLELQGADFLELGHRSNGRPNYGKLHKVVYPQLAKECEKSGTGWDQAREREEGKRLRRLIRRIHDDGSHDFGIPIPKRQEYHPPPQSASVPSDAGSEMSPVPVYEPVSATSGTGTVESSPGQTFSVQASHAGYQRHSGGQMRSVTLPIPSSRESLTFEPSVSEATPWPRVPHPRTASSSVIGLDHRRQSPSVSSDGGPLSAVSLRQYEESPQSGSPAAQHASLAYPGLTSLSTGDLSSKYEHSRGNSSDSAMGMGRGPALMVTARYYETRKQGQATARPPQESGPRQSNNENSAASYPKESSKGFLGNFFKRKPPKNPDSNHPSPEEHGLESPTSPMYIRQQNNSFLPFTKSDYNTSDVSLGDRLSTAAMSDNASIRTKASQKLKKWIFVTSDLLNYRLVDITDIDSVDTLRTVICSKLGIFDWPSAQIFLTEPGKVDHDEPMNDTMLWVCQGRKADAVASLKLYVRGTHSTHFGASNPSYIAPGLGVAIPEKPVTASPTTGHQLQRKPLDDEAINRVLHSTQSVQPSSPLNSRHSALNVSTVHPAARDSSQFLPTEPLGDGVSEAGQSLVPDKADLLARHEEHQRDVERKQKAYRISKQPPLQQPRKDMYGETGYRREGVIDFDSPRISPYEDNEKKPDKLIPHRKPPSAPPESNTLTKVNSLSKRNRGHLPSQTRGLAAAIASVGKMSSSIGTPSPVATRDASNQDFGRQHADTGLVYSGRTSPGKESLKTRPPHSSLIFIIRILFLLFI